MGLRKIKENFLQIGIVDGMGTFVFFPKQSKIILLVDRAQKSTISMTESVTTLQTDIEQTMKSTKHHPYLFGVVVSILAIITSCIAGSRLSHLKTYPLFSYCIFLLLSFLSGMELGMIWRGWVTDCLRTKMETASGQDLVEVERMSSQLKHLLIKKQINDICESLFITLLVLLVFQLFDIWHITPDMYIDALPQGIPTALFTVYASFIMTIAWKKNPVFRKFKCIQRIKNMQVMESDNN